MRNLVIIIMTFICAMALCSCQQHTMHNKQAKANCPQPIMVIGPDTDK